MRLKLERANSKLTSTLWDSLVRRASLGASISIFKNGQVVARVVPPVRPSAAEEDQHLDHGGRAALRKTSVLHQPPHELHQPPNEERTCHIDDAGGGDGRASTRKDVQGQLAPQAGHSASVKSHRPVTQAEKNPQHDGAEEHDGAASRVGSFPSSPAVGIAHPDGEERSKVRTRRKRSDETVRLVGT